MVGPSSYLEEKKRKRQYEINRRSNIKRQYLRLKKQEEKNSATNDTTTASNVQDELTSTDSQSIQKKKGKANPFQKLQIKKAQEEAEKEAQRLVKNFIHEFQRKREQEARRKEAYLKKRKDMRTKLSKKTVKGQPNMNNVVNHLLAKLLDEQKNNDK